MTAYPFRKIFAAALIAALAALPEIDAVIDELAIWSRPLGAVEVAGLYAKALTGAGIVGAAPTALKISGITAAGGNVTITWAGGAGIKLQSAATLGGAWTDVTGSDGASTATVPAGNAAAFFGET